MTTGIDGATQVGMAQTYDYLWHACIWSGTPQSRIELNPPGPLAQSYCLAADGGYQVGSSNANGSDWACVWSGSAASRVSIHPEGAYYSRATSIDGTQVGGYGIFDNSQRRAGMWTSFAPSAWIELHPAVANISTCLGLHSGTQVGSARIGTTTTASLWTGSAASWVSLRPSGAGLSVAYAVHNGWQAGSARFGIALHAGVWRGSAATWEDLTPTISANYDSSEALAIWDDGTTLYVAGYGVNVETGHQDGLLWTRPLCCHADFNCSNALSAQDIFDFLAAWFALDPRADYNGVGAITAQDIFDFLTAWFAGC